MFWLLKNIIFCDCSNAAIIVRRITKVENNVFPSVRNQILGRIAEYRGEVVFYTKMVVNDILIELERILDYAGVG